MRKSVQLALVQSVLLVASPVWADLISQFTGNTQTANVPAPTTMSPGVDFTNNFAVFADTGQNGAAGGIGSDPALAPLFSSVFTPGNGSAGTLNPSAHYLYLFQPVNNGSIPTTISQFNTSLGAMAPADSRSNGFGQFNGVRLTTSGGPVSSSHTVGPNNAGGAGPFLFSPGSTRTVTPADGPISFATGQTTTPALVSLSPTSLQANYTFNGVPATPGLEDGQVGSLLAFASDLPPAFFSGGVIDGGTTAFGAAPAPLSGGTSSVPEPGSLLIWAASLAGLGWVGRRPVVPIAN